MAQRDSYAEALNRASLALYEASQKRKQRKKESNPLYAAGSFLEPIGRIADIPLSWAGLPPIAGATASGIKNLGGAMEGEGAEGFARDTGQAVASYMRWQTEQDRKKKEEDREKREKSRIEEFRKMFG